MNLRKALILSLFLHMLPAAVFLPSLWTSQLGAKYGQKALSVSFIEVPIEVHSNPQQISEPQLQQKSGQMKQTLKKVAATASSEAGPVHQESSVLSNYLWEVRKVIEQKKFYPVMAKRLKQQGIVEVDFTLDQKGQVIKINKLSSQHKSLSEAVQKMLTQEKIFPEFPGELHAQTLEVSVPVRFRLE